MRWRRRLRHALTTARPASKQALHSSNCIARTVTARAAKAGEAPTSLRASIDAAARTAGGWCFFYQGTPEATDSKADEHALYCEQLFHLIATGFIRGGSFGYQILEARPIYGESLGAGCKQQTAPGAG